MAVACLDVEGQWLNHPTAGDILAFFQSGEAPNQPAAAKFFARTALRCDEPLSSLRLAHLRWSGHPRRWNGGGQFSRRIPCGVPRFGALELAFKLLHGSGWLNDSRPQWRRPVAYNVLWIYNGSGISSMQVSKWGNSLAVRLPAAVVE